MARRRSDGIIKEVISSHDAHYTAVPVRPRSCSVTSRHTAFQSASQSHRFQAVRVQSVPVSHTVLVQSQSMTPCSVSLSQ